MLADLCFLYALTALTTAAPVPMPDNRASEEALKQVTEILAKTEGNANARVELWCEVARLRQKLGDRDGASGAFREARAIAGGPPKAAVENWRRIATALGQFGETKVVLDLADSIPEKVENRRDNPRHTVLREAATAAAHAGHTKSAEQIADALPDETARKRLRESIHRAAIVAQIKAGDATAALRAVDELKTAEEKLFALVGRPVLEFAYDDIGPDDGIASAQLRTGDKAGAKQTALKALALLPEVEKDRRGAAAVAVVQVLARLDDVPAAKKAIAHVPAGDPALAGKDEDRGRATQELLAKGFVAIAEVRAGGDAKGVLEDVTRKGDRAYLLHTVALAQARAGKKDDAKANFALALERIEADPDGAGTTAHNIASAQALSGDISGAVDNAKRLKCSVVTWANIVGAQLAAGDFDGARETAASQIAGASSFWYARVLRQIAHRQAGAGRAAAVQEWAGKLDDSVLRAHVLLGLAEGLYREPTKR